MKENDRMKRIMSLQTHLAESSAVRVWLVQREGVYVAHSWGFLIWWGSLIVRLPGAEY